MLLQWPISRVWEAENLNALSREIIDWARRRNFWLSVVHLPGALNNRADMESLRARNHDTELILDKLNFHSIVQVFGRVHVDLFAIRLSFQVAPYVAWRPDPIVMAVDAFALKWA